MHKIIIYPDRHHELHSLLIEFRDYTRIINDVLFTRKSKRVKAEKQLEILRSELLKLFRTTFPMFGAYEMKIVHVDPIRYYVGFEFEVNIPSL